MPKITSWRLRLRAVFRRSQVDRELDEELAFYLDERERQYIADGLSAEEARLAARRDLGSVAHVKDHMRDVLRLDLLVDFFRDLRYAMRGLRRTPGFATVAVLSLAVGIGASVVVFSTLNSVSLRKLPVQDPDSLVRLQSVGPNDMVTEASDYAGFSNADPAGLAVRTTFSYPMYRQFAAANTTMDALFACAPLDRATVVVDGRVDIATAFVSSGNYYRVLGLTANPGRTIVPDDDQATAPPVAVISARYWRQSFGSDPGIVGKVVRFNSVPVTIVGVISPELPDVQRPVRNGPDIAIPLSVMSQLANRPVAPGEPNLPLLERPTYWWLQVMGRLKPNVTAAQVQANLQGMFQQTARAGLTAYLESLSPGLRASSFFRNRTQVPQLRVASGSRGMYDVSPSVARVVAILGGVVVLTLLIVCANVTNLLLSRGETRHREVSIRLSMGATRGRLVRQLLAESLVLAAIGGAIGILVARWGQGLLPASLGQVVPLDWRVLLFVLAVTSVTGLAFGIVPALRASGTNVNAALKDNARALIGRRRTFSRALLVVQVAISIVLLVAAGLFLRTLENLRRVDVGFNTRALVLFRVAPSSNRYDQAQATALYQRLLESLRKIPGAQSVALSNVQLLAGSVNSTNIFVQGRTYTPDQRDPINQLVISPGFFETMEMPIRAGRGLSERDDQSAQRVAVINETASRKYFPNDNPIGQRIGSNVEAAGQIEIVGVLRDALYDSVRDPVPPTMYVPYLQRPMKAAAFQVRMSADLNGTVNAIREAVRHIDPELPLMDVSTQIEQIDTRLSQERLFARTYAMFGGLALLLASIGLFGLMSYSVSRRTNEIGVRMALGATYQDVLRLVMGEAVGIVLAGVAIGVLSAAAATRLVASMLFGVAPNDWLTMLTAAALMVIVSMIAGYLPARRAARVDPLVALQCE